MIFTTQSPLIDLRSVQFVALNATTKGGYCRVENHKFLLIMMTATVASAATVSSATASSPTTNCVLDRKLMTGLRLEIAQTSTGGIKVTKKALKLAQNGSKRIPS